ncbi:hypothetical protein [Cupriavidus sp. AcVe19-1a]|uniref:hypothetical protein n=1 Tax=Cupriavidus sp. AcVe19-1a TaxID=2821359 RepID=UPI001AEB18E9|nr:hypothetical protein [Cupriavidus sp. AcVe19-1a]MBP0631979.1 hypothetical protein [Cupriavidus sp. AcVe19-1a]
MLFPLYDSKITSSAYQMILVGSAPAAARCGWRRVAAKGLGPESWPYYTAPIVRVGVGGQRENIRATFGMVPHARIPGEVRPFDSMNAR